MRGILTFVSSRTYKDQTYASVGIVKAEGTRNADSAGCEAKSYEVVRGYDVGHLRDLIRKDGEPLVVDYDVTEQQFGKSLTVVVSAMEKIGKLSEFRLNAGGLVPITV